MADHGRHPAPYKPAPGEFRPLSEIIKERDGNYGPFKTQGDIVQALKDVMRKAPGWEKLSSDQKEALDMMANKQSRVLNGNANHLDSWVDMAGYPQLIVDRLKKEHAERMVPDTIR